MQSSIMAPSIGLVSLSVTVLSALLEDQVSVMSRVRPLHCTDQLSPSDTRQELEQMKHVHAVVSVSLFSFRQT